MYTQLMCTSNISFYIYIHTNSTDARARTQKIVLGEPRARARVGEGKPGNSRQNGGLGHVEGGSRRGRSGMQSGSRRRELCKEGATREGGSKGE